MTARTEANRTHPTAPAETGEPVVTTRVDRSHEVSPAVADDSQRPGSNSSNAAAPNSAHAIAAKDDVHTLLGATALVGEATDDRTELETLARQLGRELDARQAELDAREEELNRRLAEFDQEMRRSRLWLEERRREIEEREVEIGARRADVEARLDRILAHERELDARRADRDRAPSAAAAPDDDAQQPASEADVADVHASAFEPLAATAITTIAAARCGHDNEMRLRRLDEAEALLAVEQQSLAEVRRRLAADRAAAKEAERAERRAWADERSRQEDALRRRHESLRQRAAQLDARSESLEQLRRDLTVAQRETLEMRVAVQELWLQLCGRAAPAAMLQSLAEARAKLAAQYRDADGEFDAAEKRLRAAAADLAQQLNQLKEQRRQFQTWADERQAAIERQAARLVAREQELEAQEQRFGDCEQSWTEQRLGFRRQIRRLLAELRAADRGGAEAAAS